MGSGRGEILKASREIDLLRSFVLSGFIAAAGDLRFLLRQKNIKK
jgi:hypothetical protein